MHIIFNTWGWVGGGGGGSVKVHCVEYIYKNATWNDYQGVGLTDMEQ